MTMTATTIKALSTVGEARTALTLSAISQCDQYQECDVWMSEQWHD